MKPWMFRLHRWIGALAALYIALLAATGTILHFRDQLEKWLEPELFEVSSGAGRLPLAALLATAREAFPASSPRFIFPPRTPGDPALVELASGLEIFLDPHNGKILGARHIHSGFLGTIRSLHVGILLGSAGKWIGLASGASLLALAVTGLGMGRPLRLAQWRMVLKAPGSRGLPLLHYWAGILFLPSILIAAVTGSYLLFSASVGKFLSALDPGLSRRQLITTEIAPSQISGWDAGEFASQAETLFPGCLVTRLALPLQPGDPWVVRVRQPRESHPNGLTFLTFDPASLPAIAVRNPFPGTPLSRFVAGQFPWHIGQYAGWLGPLLHPLAGFTLFGLAISGLILFLKRKPFRRASQNGSAITAKF